MVRTCESCLQEFENNRIGRPYKLCEICRLKKKFCFKCKTYKSTDNFNKNKSRSNGLESYCRDCRSLYNQDAEIIQRDKDAHLNWRKQNPKNLALSRAKQRAKKQGIAFDLTLADIPDIPTLCPILGIELKLNDGRFGPDSPSLDRIIPELGYVAGNVQWICSQANVAKNNLSIEQLILMGEWAKSVI